MNPDKPLTPAVQGGVATVDTPSRPAIPQTVGVATDEKQTYGQILRSSTLIGGSSVVNIAIGIVRTKVLAVFLGPAGFGLMGLYGSIADLAQSIAGMGVNSSGVRQIAEAVGSGETERIARTVAVLRRASILLGILGAILLVIFSRQVSTLTFGSDQHAAAISLLSLAVFFSLVSAGQRALVQGTRRIAYLAKMGMLGALYGLIISIPIVYLLREQGVVPALIGSAAMSIVTSWWYSRKIGIRSPAMTVFQFRRELGPLLKLGFAFMASGFLMMGTAYAVRTLLLRTLDLESAGFYQAAWTLGGLYVGFILQAMGADFYPRLTAVARDHALCNRMVNEQTQISLLLAGPGVVGTIAFAPIVIELFYSTEFSAAVGVLRWICLGMALRVITWPMGFIILARGEQRYFFWTEVAWTIVNLGLSWVCIRSFGLIGAGIAFWGSYVFHGVMIYPIVRRLSGFRWSSANWRTGLFFLASIAVVFCGSYVLPTHLEIALGTLVVMISGIYSIRVLLSLVSLDRIPTSIRQGLVRFRMVRTDS